MVEVIGIDRERAGEIRESAFGGAHLDLVAIESTKVVMTAA
jgi:hypothetical protein